MAELNMVQMIAVWALPILFAVTVHEAAHGLAAKHLGDPTAERLGRLTLNPVRHIDPLGTIAVPVLLLLTTGFVFGWAKPVPVTWENLRRPNRDMALVAAAGPAANLLMAVLWVFVFYLGYSMIDSMSMIGYPLALMGSAGVTINLVLMVLNLLPIPPLDGSRVVSAALPGPLAWKFNQIERYGFLILLALLITGVLGRILLPVVDALRSGLFTVFGFLG